MFYCPYCYLNRDQHSDDYRDEYQDEYRDQYNRMRPNFSHVRIFHASPDAPGVDVYSNNNLIARDLRFKRFTDYLPFPAGTYNIRVYATGTTKNPVIDTRITVVAGKIITAAAIGRLANISLKLIEDSREALRPGRVRVRFGHLSPNAPMVDVALKNGNVIFNDVKYDNVTGYIELRPGVYDLEVRLAATGQRVLDLPNTRFRPNRFYSVYAIGVAGGTPPLQAVIPLDGNSYIRD